MYLSATIGRQSFASSISEFAFTEVCFAISFLRMLSVNYEMFDLLNFVSCR